MMRGSDCPKTAAYRGGGSKDSRYDMGGAGAPLVGRKQGLSCRGFSSGGDEPWR